MNPRQKKRMGMILVLLIGVCTTVGLVLYALNQNMDLFYTPTELVHGKPDGSKAEVGQRLRVGGMVVRGSVVRAPDSLKITFKLADVGPHISVEYEGILPDLFREGQGIVAQGVLKEDNTLEAFEILAKHDEDYVPSELAEAMEKVHEPMGYSTKQLEGSNQ